MTTRLTPRWIAILATSLLIAGACSSDALPETTEASTTTTTPVEASTTLPQTTAAPITTVPEETTTTVGSFDLASLSEDFQQRYNFWCAWATGADGNFGIDTDGLRLEIQSGSAIEPFLAAAEGVDLEDVDAMRTALAGACDEFGAPTEEFLNDNS